jgi:hypothetical protein
MFEPPREPADGVAAPVFRQERRPDSAPRWKNRVKDSIQATPTKTR